jgi:hypothetical protein
MVWLGLPISCPSLEIIMANQAQATSSFFDFIANGVGYFYPRFVNVNKGGRKTSFWAARISVLKGPKGNPSFETIDAKVTDQADLIKLIQDLMPHAKAKRNVLVGFSIGDLWANPYPRKIIDEHGNDTGETEPAAIIKARLIKIDWAKVDGEMVYRRPRPEQANEQQQSQGDPQTATPAAKVNQPPQPAAQQPSSQPAKPPTQGKGDQPSQSGKPEPQPAEPPAQDESAPVSDQEDYVGTACEDDIPY